MAAYFASYNPSDSDKKIFGEVSLFLFRILSCVRGYLQKAGKKRRAVTVSSKVHQNQHELGAKAFTLDRLKYLYEHLYIYLIVKEPVGRQLKITQQVGAFLIALSDFARLDSASSLRRLSSTRQRHSKHSRAKVSVPRDAAVHRANCQVSSGDTTLVDVRRRVSCGCRHFVDKNTNLSQLKILRGGDFCMKHLLYDFIMEDRM